MVEPTQTIELEGTVAALLDGRTCNGASTLPGEETQTLELEGTLASLLDHPKEASTLPMEETQTMELEGTLASLLDHPKDASTLRMEDTQTMQLEGTLASLLEDCPGKDTDNDVTLPSLSSTSTPPVRNDGHRCVNDMGDDESQTMNLEGTMASLLEAAPDDVTCELSAQSQTVPLDNNLDVLLEGASDEHIPREDDTISELGMNTASHELRNGASNRHMPREDDTISELGMNTASHELRHEKEMSLRIAQKVAITPPEPVDLKLEEVVELGEIDWDRTMESNGDILLKALGVASENVCPTIKPESEKVFTQICEDIESQLHNIEGGSLFREKIENNEELMRILQQKLRAEASSDNANSDVKDQARLLLQAENEAQLAEWNQWLTEVAAVYNSELSNTIVPMIQNDNEDISEKSSLIDQNREQIALPLLIRSARRATKRNFERTKGEVSSCEDEVSELEAQVEEAERQLEALQSTHGRIHEVAKSNEKSDALRKEEKDQRQTADSSYYKFFSVERLHNWVLTGSSDSSISLVFRGMSAETSIQLSFSICGTSAVTLNAKFDCLPRSTNSFLSMTGVKQTRFHPAVSVFLKTKMDLLCTDMKNSHISTPSEISSMIHFAELRVARIEEAAKELDIILSRCRNSFLQPSDSLKYGYDFTAYLSSGSRKGNRLNVILSIPDCYPFAPIGLHLHSTSSSFDTESMTRQLKKSIKPGFGALTRALDTVQSMLN